MGDFKASVIIPSYNNSFLLEKAIISLIYQTLPGNEFEIIVVDNGSTDNTKNLVTEFIKKNPNHYIRYFYDDEPGLLTGRHRGANEAKTDILVFIDDDIEAFPEWLSSIVETFEDPSIHLVGGKCLPLYDAEVPGWEKSLWIKTNEYTANFFYSLIDQGDEIKDCDANLIFGLSFSIRKQTLIDLGGFHPDVIPKNYMKFLGDGETGLTMKLKNKGLRAVYNPNVAVYHHVTSSRLTMEYIEKRQYYQGVCDSYTHIRNVESTSENTTSKKSLFVLYKRKLKSALKSKVSLIIKNQKEELPPEIAELNTRMQKAYLEGYMFHRNEIEKDKRLIDWIRKENYFDYKLPQL